jgi:hypothetical protein
MQLIPEKRLDYQIRYSLIYNKKPTMKNIAEDLGVSYVYLRQMFTGKDITKRNAERMSALVNEDVKVFFRKDN